MKLSEEIRELLAYDFNKLVEDNNIFVLNLFIKKFNLEVMSIASKIESLEKQNEEMIELIKEADEYLSKNKLNYIGSQSILHRKFKKWSEINE